MDIPKRRPDMSRETYLAQFAVTQELQRRKILNQPIAVYDPETQEVYLEYADGSRELVGHRLREGRFSERKP